MTWGLSIRDRYFGPPIDAIQFHLDHTTLGAAPGIIQQARSWGAKSVSAHLPISEKAEDVLKLAYIGESLGLDYMVAHITIQTPYQDWVVLKPLKDKIFIENHNQEKMSIMTAGWCWPEQFKIMTDAGFKLNLDIGHAMLCCAWPSSDSWYDRAEEVFAKFLEQPIGAAHIHTINKMQNGFWNDHQIHGVNPRPWIKRLMAKYPDAVLIGELPNLPEAVQIASMKGWIE